MEIVDYRDYLKNELGAIQQARPRYSLRAFARDSGLCASFLSQLLNHKKKLSLEKARQIGMALKWESEKIGFFSSLVQYQNCADAAIRATLRKELMSYRKRFPLYYNLKEEQFRLISEWYHFALLELTQIKDFKSDVNWLARKLGVTPARCEDAISRLKRLGLLESRDGRLTKTKSHYKVANITSQAIRSYHRQNLERARLALDGQAMSDREFIGATMAVDPKKLPLAKKKMARFTSELMTFLEQGEKTVIYHFSSQLFRAQEG